MTRPGPTEEDSAQEAWIPFNGIRAEDLAGSSFGGSSSMDYRKTEKKQEVHWFTGGSFATFCEKVGDPLKRNPSLRGVEQFSTKGGKKTPYSGPPFTCLQLLFFWGGSSSPLAAPRDRCRSNNHLRSF